MLRNLASRPQTIMTPTQFTTLINELQTLEMICGCGFAGVMFWAIVSFLKK